VSSYDWLLFLHVLFAFTLVTGVVILVPYGVGRPDTPLIGRLAKVGGALAPIGGMGTLIFGLILVANRDYKFFSFWILAAIVLWVVGTATGERVMRVDDRGKATRLFWISSLALFLMLVVMIFKPGA
jgi:hypothetical protein